MVAGWSRLAGPAPAPAAPYVEYITRTGLSAYEKKPGNLGAQMWTTDLGDGRTEVMTVSQWSSRADIEGFAGQNIDVTVFYPEDDDYLIDRETTVRHYDVAPTLTPPGSAGISDQPHRGPRVPGMAAAGGMRGTRSAAMTVVRRLGAVCGGAGSSLGTPGDLGGGISLSTRSMRAVAGHGGDRPEKYPVGGRIAFGCGCAGLPCRPGEEGGSDGSDQV